MDSSKFILFEKMLDGFIDYNAGEIMLALKGMLKEADHLPATALEEFTPKMIVNTLFRDVLRCMFNESRNDGVPANPEETVAELVRKGLPKEDVMAGFKHLTAFLPNAAYRLYRLTSGYPSGTIRISRDNCNAEIRSGYEPKELAEFIHLLDPLLPKINEAAEALYQEINREIIRKQAEIKALEIAKQAVEAQLAAVLPDMGISFKFNISDDKVRLDLTRMFKACIDIPLTELSNLLSDPERIESALKAVPEPEYFHFL